MARSKLKNKIGDFMIAILILGFIAFIILRRMWIERHEKKHKKRIE